MAHQGPGGARKPVEDGAVGRRGHLLLAPGADRAGGGNRQPAFQHGHPDRRLRHRRPPGPARHAPDLRKIPGGIRHPPPVLVRRRTGKDLDRGHAAGRARVLPQHLPHCLPAKGALDPGHRPAGLAASGMDGFAGDQVPAVSRPQGTGHVVHRDPGLCAAGQLLRLLPGRPLRLVDGVLPVVLPARRLAGDADVGQCRGAAAARGAARVLRQPHVRLGARAAVHAADDRGQLHQCHGGGAGLAAIHRPSDHGQAPGLGQNHA
ncbi:hypothetical protein D9M68_688520 [compost metagenome]